MNARAWKLAAREFRTMWRVYQQMVIEKNGELRRLRAVVDAREAERDRLLAIAREMRRADRDGPPAAYVGAVDRLYAAVDAAEGPC